MSPLDENHQALLIRLYRLAGDDDAAERSSPRGRRPPSGSSAPRPAPLSGSPCGNGRATATADDRRHHPRDHRGRARRRSPPARSAPASRRFETAVRLADRPARTSLRVQTRLVLAEALIHTLRRSRRGGRGHLTRRSGIAVADGDAKRRRGPAPSSATSTSCARATTGPSAGSTRRWRARARPRRAAKAMTYLGSVASDRADYPRAVALLDEAARLSRAARRAAPRGVRPLACSAGSTCSAATSTSGGPASSTPSVDLAEREHWLAFLPWPQALPGTCCSRQGDLAGAARLPASSPSPGPASSATRAGRASRRAGLALVAEASGTADRRSRAARRPGPVHPAGRSLRVARRAHPRRPVPARPQARAPDTRRWVDDMRELVLAHRHAGAVRARHAARGRPGQCRGLGRRRAARGPDRQPCPACSCSHHQTSVDRLPVRPALPDPEPGHPAVRVDVEAHVGDRGAARRRRNRCRVSGCERRPAAAGRTSPPGRPVEPPWHAGSRAAARARCPGSRRCPARRGGSRRLAASRTTTQSLPSSRRRAFSQPSPMSRARPGQDQVRRRRVERVASSRPAAAVLQRGQVDGAGPGTAGRAPARRAPGTGPRRRPGRWSAGRGSTAPVVGDGVALRGVAAGRRPAAPASPVQAAPARPADG